MMRRLLLPLTSLAFLAALAAPPSGAWVGETGPFAGAVAQDQTNGHAWDNSPPEPEPCPQYFAPLHYEVILAYAPPSDVLTLGVQRGDDVRVVEGVDGFARFAFEGGGCEPMTLHVTGSQVATVAAYSLDVLVRQPAPPPSE